MNDYGEPSTIEEFDALHNGATSVIGDNCVYYEDGARRDNYHVLCGKGINPPTDPFERWKRIVRYHELWLKREVDAFDDFNRRLIGVLKQPNGGLPSEKEAAEHGRLAQVVLDRKKQLAKAEKKREKADPDYVPPKERERRAEEEARYQAKRDAMLKRIMKVKV